MAVKIVVAPVEYDIIWVVPPSITSFVYLFPSALLTSTGKGDNGRYTPLKTKILNPQGNGDFFVQMWISFPNNAMFRLHPSVFGVCIWWHTPMHRMGRTEYLPTWMAWIYGINVDKYSSHIRRIWDNFIPTSSGFGTFTCTVLDVLDWDFTHFHSTKNGWVSWYVRWKDVSCTASDIIRSGSPPIWDGKPNPANQAWTCRIEICSSILWRYLSDHFQQCPKKNKDIQRSIKNWMGPYQRTPK